MTDKTEAMDLAKTLADLNKQRMLYWHERERLVRLGAKIGFIHEAEEKSNKAYKSLRDTLVSAYRTGKLVVVPVNAAERIAWEIISAGYNPATAHHISEVALAALKGADHAG